MKKILFCQFSNNLINKRNSKKEISSIYYKAIWQKRKNQGYFKNRHFWEIPLWIAEISGLLKNRNFKKDLYIVKNLKQAINYLNNNNFDFILFSCLDVNKNLILEIIKNSQGNSQFIIGGYTSFTDFEKINNVIILNSVLKLSNYLKIPYVYDLDFTLFKNYKTIPRLTLSKGCLNSCKFCTVEKILKEKTKEDILKQIKAFKDLTFKLIYLNDKTFFQAKNYFLLKYLYKEIKKYNKNFQGFIIQTTCTMILKHYKELEKLKIYVVELGIETFNNEILKDLNKPINEKTIINSINKLKELKIKIIPNFIIGFLQENKKTYNKTLKFIKLYLRAFFFLNIYNLAVYQNTELNKTIKLNDNDLNELNNSKTFHNSRQKKNSNHFYNAIFKLGLKILNRRIKC